ncbi:PEP-CTERM sorting domain-containing protein [Nostoc spongiaeforme FACHB-130]|uniref:PEP-CTERM sorting domain-containing protein n=1 Tax=Nostoc spongiaeforme FACHB-130 TaxID=1357510 RepID=A0ABR8FW15_9NOSO|nr:PEP-CTERM sorting domain-containing protein [Nostoc spongiaeforme]MBD2595553.1 PEP-CTERM sorting domain-containing protein [Nostoc spongiaeforme FACHB-130]
MASSVVKISLCAVSFLVIGVWGQQSVWGLSNTSLREPEQGTSQAEVTEDENHTSPNHYYTPSLSLTPRSDAPVSSYIPAYSNKWANLSSTNPSPRKVPEPSVLLGLIAIAGCLGMQHQLKKAR